MKVMKAKAMSMLIILVVSGVIGFTPAWAGGGYCVQVVSCRYYDNAAYIRDRLREGGFNAYIESVYIEKYDCILHLRRTTRRGEKGLVYVCDLGAGNRWSKAGIALPIGVGPGTGLAYDPALDVLVLADNPTQGPCRLWLMRYVPAQAQAGQKK